MSEFKVTPSVEWRDENAKACPPENAGAILPDTVQNVKVKTMQTFRRLYLLLLSILALADGIAHAQETDVANTRPAWMLSPLAFGKLSFTSFNNGGYENRGILCPWCICHRKYQ